MSSLLPAALAPLARVERERGSFACLGVLAPLHLLKLLDRDLAALLRLSRLAQLALVSRLDADAAATLAAAAALALPGHGDRVPEIGSVHTFSAVRACACAWSAVPGPCLVRCRLPPRLSPVRRDPPSGTGGKARCQARRS